MVQWLGLQASNAEDVGSIPGQGTGILHALQHSQKRKKKTEVAALGNYWMVTKSKKEKRATEDKMAG